MVKTMCKKGDKGKKGKKPKYVCKSCDAMASSKKKVCKPKKIAK